MIKKGSFFAILVSLFVFMGCDSNVIYTDYKNIDDIKWDRNKSIAFEFQVDDTLKPVDFYILLANETSYKYCNLYMFLRTYYPQGGMSQDTIECLLANKNGEWLGKGLNVRDNKMLLMKGLRFPRKGLYRFEFEQAMRDEILSGVTSLGIRIEESK